MFYLKWLYGCTREGQHKHVMGTSVQVGIRKREGAGDKSHGKQQMKRIGKERKEKSATIYLHVISMGSYGCFHY